MSNFEERTLVGIINPNVYITKSNNKDCSYIDIAFEQMPDTENRNANRYSVVNMETFLDEPAQVFLTSNAKNMISKFGECKLVKLIANPSPEERGCKYTAYSEKITKLDPYDFVEIMEPKVEDFRAAEKTAYIKYRPSTDYVMVKCTKYTVSRDDFPFVKKTEEFFNEKDAQKYVRDCFNTTYFNVDRDNLESFTDNNYFAARELNGQFFRYIRDAVAGNLPEDADSSIDEQAVRSAVQEQIRRLADDSAFVSETSDAVARDIRAVAAADDIIARNHELLSGKDENAGGEDDAGNEEVQSLTSASVSPAVPEQAASQEPSSASGERAEPVSAAPVLSEPVVQSAGQEQGTSAPLSSSAVSAPSENQSSQAKKPLNSSEYLISDENIQQISERISKQYRVEKTINSEQQLGSMFGMHSDYTQSFCFGLDDSFKSGNPLRDAVSMVSKKQLLERMKSQMEAMGIKPEDFSSLSSVEGMNGVPNGGEEEEEEEEAVNTRSSASGANEHVFSEKLYGLIRAREVIMGPFMINANKITRVEDAAPYQYRCTLTIPDNNRCVLGVKDTHNLCVKVNDYDLFQDFIRTVKVDGVSRKYLVKMPAQNWLNSGKKVDLMDNEKLVTTYGTSLLNCVFNDLKASQLSKANQNIAGTRQFKTEPERVNRFFYVMSGVVEFENERSKMFKLMMEMPEFKVFFDEYFNRNSEFIMSQLRRSMVDSLKNDRVEEEKKLRTIRGKIESSQSELTRIKKDLESRKSQLARTDAEPVKEAEEVQVKTKGKVKTVSAEEHEVLKSEYKQLRNEYDELKKQVGELRRTKENLDVELNHSFADLSSRYLEMHSMLKAFTTPRKVKGAGFNFESRTPSVINLDNLRKVRNRYIEDLMGTMRSYGRYMSRDNLASMVITIAQNQFTILAGLPGSGKTSFVKTMGRALNLDNRLHTIPVARGWTSQRDILGYWNSLTSSFQPAPTGLWELLTTLDEERDPSKVTPAILLLDEMNLSSPEHYFSSFMQLADGESERKIFTGSPERAYLTIPQYLRFVGTVNSDDTVNVMSARMLDRSAVILFDEKPSQSDDNRERRTGHSVNPQTYSAADWLTLFDTSEPCITNKMYQILNAVEETLYQEDSNLGQRIVVSYRKHQQIIKYLTVAAPLLEGSSENLAMDFAIRQFVLPMINGFGESFGNRLSNLADILEKNELEQSYALLQRIKSEGAERMNSYQFLA